MIHLKSVSLKNHLPDNSFPFNLPLIRQFQKLNFTSSVTIFAGDNGTGKSTLLEALATHIDSILIGGENIDSDPSLVPARKLGDQMKLSWSVRTKKGFFFRANDFITFTQRIARIKAESAAAVKDIKEKDPHSLEAMPYARTLSELNHLYGDGLQLHSHGESFLELFQARFRPGGLYILDEPEAPLSPLKQLSLISLINDMVQKDGQFIIATHSPILMAFPGADIYSIADGKMALTEYWDLEHVTLTRDFLNNPEQFLRHL